MTEDQRENVDIILSACDNDARLVRLLAQGYKHRECADALGIGMSTLATRLGKVRARFMRADDRAKKAAAVDLRGDPPYQWVLRLRAQIRSHATRQSFYRARHNKSEASLRWAAWHNGLLA